MTTQPDRPERWSRRRPGAVYEGDAGETHVPVVFHLSEVQSTDVFVSWVLGGGSADSGVDYKSQGVRTTRIKAGRIQAGATVTVLGDTSVEPDETTSVLMNVAGGAGVTVDPAPTNGLLVIADDDSDSDGDHLVDAAEFVMKLDANNPDSDGEGLPDGDEVRVWSTNPNETDTDGDGLDDLLEIKSGTDPHDPADPGGAS